MPLPEYAITKEGVQLGKALFYDPILSRDSSISCTSCHQQQNAFADNGRFSVGVDGKPTPRNSPPLYNLAWYSAMFWDGRAADIESQILHPVRDPNEMGLSWTEAAQRIRSHPYYQREFLRVMGTKKPDSTHISMAIAQFLRTILSHRSKYDRVLAGEAWFTEDEFAGFVLANDQSKGDCLHCHTTDANAVGTTGKMANNGLDPANRAIDYTDPGKGAITGDTADNGYFKIPSLRNLSFTAPYMHDGRFERLEDVLFFYAQEVKQPYNTDAKMQHAHKGGNGLSVEEQQQILAFLLTLNDSALVQDQRWSNPWK